jgi:hypothetical protein
VVGADRGARVWLPEDRFELLGEPWLPVVCQATSSLA